MIEEDSITSSNSLPEEEITMVSVRPDSFKSYIGQEEVVSQMSLFIKAALTRTEALDHTLIYGPPGLGKTTLANVIAKEMGVSLISKPAGLPLLFSPKSKRSSRI